MQISARNQLRGKVQSVDVQGLVAEVVIDVGGQHVVATITEGSARQLRLMAGDEVVAIIKASEVMIGK
jgi:molybdopterin-binding protein